MDGDDKDEISRDDRNVWNRLMSIYYDTLFIENAAKRLPYPIVVNLRCGRWYMREAAETCYFKSTDGHYGNWSFSLSRLNLHLLELVRRNSGIVIVDATRKGKLYPDALSKSIPIWIAVMNRLLYDEDIDDERCCYPGLSTSEDAQIRSRLDGWVKSVLDMGLDGGAMERRLDKPMRPYWISQDEASLENICVASHCYPVYLLSASSNHKLHPPTLRSSNNDRQQFEYIPGAADDEESWSQGLTPSLFWQNRQILLGSTSSEVEARIKSLVDAEAEADDEFKNRTGIVLKRNELQYVGDVYQSATDFDGVLIDCNCRQYKTKPKGCRVYWWPVPNWKRDRIGLIRILPLFLQTVAECVQNDVPIMVTDDEGDLSISSSLMAAALLTFYCWNDDGMRFMMKDPTIEVPNGHVTKDQVRRVAAHVTTMVHCQCPPRSYLKQIFNFFHKGSLHGRPSLF